MNEDREQLIQNATRFLQDPQVSQSPLSKKISFLESKGLSQAEIDHAISLTSTKSSSLPATSETLGPLPPSFQSAPQATSTINTTTPPPIPQLPPPGNLLHQSQLTSIHGFDWHKLMLYVALITSAGIAVSQSVLAKWILNGYAVAKKTLFQQLGWSMAFEPNHDGTTTLASPSSLTEMIESLKKMILTELAKVRKEMEDVRNNTRYACAQSDRELDEIREELGAIRQDLLCLTVKNELTPNTKSIEKDTTFSHLPTQTCEEMTGGGLVSESCNDTANTE